MKNKTVSTKVAKTVPAIKLSPLEEQTALRAMAVAQGWTVLKRCNENLYRTTFPYVRKAKDSLAYQDHHADELRLQELFWTDLEEEEGISNLPERIKSALRAQAWEQGHAYGLHEVACHYPDLADLAKIAFEEGQNTK